MVRASVLGAGDDGETAATFVAHGLSTDAIVARLQISSWTVQDDLKSSLDKLDVRTRRQLVARLFFEHFAARLGKPTPAPVASPLAMTAAPRDVTRGVGSGGRR